MGNRAPHANTMAGKDKRGPLTVPPLNAARPSLVSQFESHPFGLDDSLKSNDLADAPIPYLPIEKTRLYLAGPMRLLPYFNFPAFDKAAAELRAAGYEVFSPAEHDRDVYGDDFELKYPTGESGPEFDLRGALATDTRYICEQADGVALLPGWSGSSGATAEMALARALALPSRTVVQWIDGADGYLPSWAEISTPQLQDSPSRYDRVPVGARKTFPRVNVPAEDSSPSESPVYQNETRTVSATGGEKGVKQARYDLIPTGPLKLLAEHYGTGALKYADRNYESGYEWSKSYAALQRHANAWWGGETFDPENGANHMTAVAWHAFALLLFSETMPGYDDRPQPKEPPF